MPGYFSKIWLLFLLNEALFFSPALLSLWFTKKSAREINSIKTLVKHSES